MVILDDMILFWEDNKVFSIVLNWSMAQTSSYTDEAVLQNWIELLNTTALCGVLGCRFLLRLLALT